MLKDYNKIFYLRPQSSCVNETSEWYNMLLRYYDHMLNWQHIKPMYYQELYLIDLDLLPYNNKLLLYADMIDHNLDYLFYELESLKFFRHFSPEINDKEYLYIKNISITMRGIFKKYNIIEYK